MNEYYCYEYSPDPYKINRSNKLSVYSRDSRHDRIGVNSRLLNTIFEKGYLLSRAPMTVALYAGTGARLPDTNEVEKTLDSISYRSSDKLEKTSETLTDLNDEEWLCIPYIEEIKSSQEGIENRFINLIDIDVLTAQPECEETSNSFDDDPAFDDKTELSSIFSRLWDQPDKSFDNNTLISHELFMNPKSINENVPTNYGACHRTESMENSVTSVELNSTVLPSQKIQPCDKSVLTCNSDDETDSEFGVMISFSISEDRDDDGSMKSCRSCSDSVINSLKARKRRLEKRFMKSQTEYNRTTHEFINMSNERIEVKVAQLKKDNLLVPSRMTWNNKIAEEEKKVEDPLNQTNLQVYDERRCDFPTISYRSIWTCCTE